MDITPDAPARLDGMIRNRRSEGVHDRIHARALALSADGSPGETFVMVSVEVCALGEADSEVGVIALLSAVEPKKTVAVLFNHAGHPNVMSGDNLLVSGDYAGAP